MHQLKRQAIVPYSTRQMFELVDNINDYPRFLPWCQKASEQNREETEVVASLEIAWKGIHKQFTTRNRLTRYDHIEIDLLNGPLKHLQGDWQFIALSPDASKVILNLEFAFSGGWVDTLFQPIFQHIANSLVEAFCARAVELYGHERSSLR